MARVEVASGGHRRLPLSPSWLPARTFFIKLNIGIDLNNLTTCPTLPCRVRAYGGTGRACGLVPHQRTGSRA